MLFINPKFISIDQSSVIVPKIIGLKFCGKSLDEEGGKGGGGELIKVWFDDWESVWAVKPKPYITKFGSVRQIIPFPMNPFKHWHLLPS